MGGEVGAGKRRRRNKKGRNRLESAPPRAMSSDPVHDPCLPRKLYLNQIHIFLGGTAVEHPDLFDRH